MDLPPLAKAPPLVACPWCWQPGDEGFRVLNGGLERHVDLVRGRDCRGSGRSLEEARVVAAVDTLCRRILERAGHPDWNIRWTPAAPSHCIHKAREIWMYDQRHVQPWYYGKEAFVHEVAHIDTKVSYTAGCPAGAISEARHGPKFFRRLGALHQACADLELEP